MGKEEGIGWREVEAWESGTSRGSPHGVPWQAPSLAIRGYGPTRGSQCCEEPAEWLSRRYPPRVKWGVSAAQLSPNRTGVSRTEPSSSPTPWTPIVLPGDRHAWDLAAWDLFNFPWQLQTQGAAGPGQGGVPMSVLGRAWRRVELSKWLSTAGRGGRRCRAR